MLSKKWYVLVTALVIGGTLLAACAPAAPETVVVTKVVEKEGETVVEEVVVTATPEAVVETRPNILRVNLHQGDIPTLDPALGSDTSSIQVVGELMGGLTHLNEVTLELEPGMAKSWEASEDGLTYTFNLLEGIPWVRFNGTEVEEVLDEEGNVRYVTAQDFEYGIKRTCKPETASDYAYVAAFAFEGCGDLLYAEGYGDMSDEEKQALVDGVQATALDDYTLEVTFTSPAIYNLNIAGMWVAYAMPQWIIEEKGDRWTEPGFNQSYGPYVLEEWVHDSYIMLTKNPFWPGTEYVPQPTIEKVKGFMLEESAGFAEYEAGNMDVIGVPIADLDRVRADPVLGEELVILPRGCSYYYGFNVTKPPVDNVHMRRALSHAIDRQGLVDNVTKGGQEPAQWFCRPGMAGCPTMDSHPDGGIKSDPEAAKEELQAYLDEMGYASIDEIPEIILMHNTSEGHKRIAEAISQMWKETLGIEVTVTNQEWKVYLNTIQEDSPQVWRLGWCLDYPDANNWTYEVFSSEGHQGGDKGTNWTNEEFDTILEDAALEADSAKRQDMYAQAENILCYDDAAIAPIYWYTMVRTYKPYVDIGEGYTQTGHDAWEKWSLDLEAE
jgi:oligopeptide transport system substrate-binding protein